LLTIADELFVAIVFDCAAAVDITETNAKADNSLCRGSRCICYFEATLYKQQKLTAAYEAIRKTGFTFTSYEEK
jgi:hypothetical protein